MLTTRKEEEGEGEGRRKRGGRKREKRGDEEGEEKDCRIFRLDVIITTKSFHLVLISHLPNTVT